MSVVLSLPLSERNDPVLLKENELLGLIALGDNNAFTLLFDRYYNKVYSHALTFVKSPQDAEEMVTDIFLKVWNNRQKLPEIKNFKNYLFILSRNYLVSTIRKKVSSTVEMDKDEWLEDILQPDKQYHLKETYEVILQGIEQLSPQQNKIFKMSRLDGLTYDEIAKSLCISSRTVKFHIILALNYLREYARRHQLYPLLALVFVISLKK
jgi:RNA polymerase sigma-70 factor (ECF subfamily)